MTNINMKCVLSYFVVTIVCIVAVCCPDCLCSLNIQLGFPTHITLFMLVLPLAGLVYFLTCLSCLFFQCVIHESKTAEDLFDLKTGYYIDTIVYILFYPVMTVDYCWYV